MKIMCKNWLYSCNSLKLKYVQPACMLSSMVQTMPSAKKDELYKMITIEVKGHDLAVLNSYQKFTAMVGKELDVNIVRIYEPPKVIARMSLMKSVFVHKKHFHQYEMRTQYRVFEIKYITGSTASTFLEYIQRNLPEGVAMKVTKCEIEKFPEHIKRPSSVEKTTESTRQKETADIASFSDDSTANYNETVSSVKDKTVESTT